MEQLENYIQDEVYTLTIKTGVQAKNGRALKKEVTLDFILNGTDLKIIDMQPAIDDYMAALQNKVKELEGKLDEKDTKIAELTTSVDEKDTKIAELTTSVDEKDTKIAELTTSVDEKDTKIAELTTSVDEKDTKIAELTTSVDEKDIKISELMKSIMYHKFLNIRDLSLLKVEDVNRIMGFEGEQREYIYRYEWGTLGNNVRVDFLDNGSGYATSKGYSNITQEGLTILHQDSLDQIDLGMTYEQVANILGAAGTIIESNSNGITRIIWHHNG